MRQGSGRIENQLPYLSADAQSFGAKLVNLLMGWVFKKAAVDDALQKDLEHIKGAVEA